MDPASVPSCRIPGQMHVIALFLPGGNFLAPIQFLQAVNDGSSLAQTRGAHEHPNHTPNIKQNFVVALGSHQAHLHVYRWVGDFDARAKHRQPQGRQTPS